MRREEVNAQFLQLQTALAARRVTFDDVARCRFLISRHHIDGEAAVELRELFPLLLDDFSSRQRVISIHFCEHLDLALALTEPSTESDDGAIHLAKAGSDPDSAIARELLFRGLTLHHTALAFLPPATAWIVVQRTAAVLVSLLGVLDTEQGRHGDLSGFSARASEIATFGGELDAAERYYRKTVTRARQAEYVSGMAFGVVAVAAAGTTFALSADANIFDDRTWVAALAGAVGAVVSVLQRLTAGRLSLLDEGKAVMIRALGATRPLIGALFGLFAHLTISGGIFGFEVSDDANNALARYAAIGFIAGFFERFAQDLLTFDDRSVLAQRGEPMPDTASSAGLAYRLPATVEQTIATALRGPELVRWHGFIRASIADADNDGINARRDETGRYVLAPGRHYHVHVQLVPQPSGDTSERTVDINDGVSADEAPFTITMVSDTIPFPHSEYSAPAPPGGASDQLAIPFTTPKLPGHTLAWIQLRQQGRIVQMTPLDLVIEAPLES